MLILNHVYPTFSHSNIAQLGTTLVNWLTKEDLRLKKNLTLRTILDFRMKEFFVHFRQRHLLHFFERRNSFKVSFASMSGREGFWIWLYFPLRLPNPLSILPTTVIIRLLLAEKSVKTISCSHRYLHQELCTFNQFNIALLERKIFKSVWHKVVYHWDNLQEKA